LARPKTTATLPVAIWARMAGSASAVRTAVACVPGS
jgi:hypothetical protein